MNTSANKAYAIMLPYGKKIVIVNRGEFRRIETDIGKQEKGSTSHTQTVMLNHR